MFRRLFLTLPLWCFAHGVHAQEVNWPSPEVAQLYREAKTTLSTGGIDRSIVLFRQAIQLAPNVMILYRDLAQALNLAGKYTEAYETLAPIIEKGMADDLSYQLASAALLRSKNIKKARTILQQGIVKYPQAGLLYYELGRVFEADGNMPNALTQWLQGIQKDPSYHLNYYAAATTFANTNKPVWTILYGELFINIERQTNRSYETRKMVMDAYKKLFTGIGNSNIPTFGSGSAADKPATDFETAVVQTFARLSPVIADGLTTENLTMLRTRFIMEWSKTYSNQFPFSLFTYQDKMLRNGKFDAYNQWLWGKTEDAQQYANWLQFHQAAMTDYEQWAQSNKLQPNAADHYNRTDVKALWSKKKN